MVTYVLDSSAILRFLDIEAGVDRVTEILDEHLAGIADAVLPAVQWGEVVGTLKKRAQSSATISKDARLRALQLTIIPADADRAERAAALKAAFRLSYMDAFAVELAQTSPDHILITADFDFKPAESHIRIEFLPPKP